MFMFFYARLGLQSDYPSVKFSIAFVILEACIFHAYAQQFGSTYEAVVMLLFSSASYVSLVAPDTALLQ